MRPLSNRISLLFARARLVFRLAAAVALVISFPIWADEGSVSREAAVAVETAPPADNSASAPWSDNGYWLISTENSPQSFDETLPAFCASVRRCDDCREVRTSSLSEMLSQLTPGVPICIMVHGSFMDSPSVLPESSRTYRWLRYGAGGRPFHMIYFRWPSYRLPSPLINIDVAILGRRASRNGFYLASLLRQLPAESPVSLLGHSHGTRVISAAAHLLAGGAVEGISCPQLCCGERRLRAVFAASAIDHDWLNPGERFDRALCSLECVLNLKNCQDPALVVYPLRRIGSRRALGAVGLTAADRRELGARSIQVRELDVSEEVGFRHFWPSYTEEFGLARRVSNYLFWPLASQ
jgi:hypothetical protein